MSYDGVGASCQAKLTKLKRSDATVELVDHVGQPQDKKGGRIGRGEAPTTPALQDRPWEDDPTAAGRNSSRTHQKALGSSRRVSPGFIQAAYLF